MIVTFVTSRPAAYTNIHLRAGVGAVVERFCSASAINKAPS